MALIPGARIGVYEITALIGEGGMGQVYRATDTTLGRQVAIKILSDTFAADADRLARFEREAKTLASLNHPHIAAIYGFEKSAGTHALVMELVEGEDLSQRIARGAIPLDDGLAIAKQIAEALEAAHDQGIIHRDLKPANVKVRPDGTVKVLDFGLAKVMEPPAGSSPSVSLSPTITTPAMTQAGILLGTAAYLSPEQAKGRPADKRSDVWAFGCVLYEMLTGKRAFDGEDISDTLAFVLTKEPDWSALPSSVPQPLRRLLRRCLEKDRGRRLRDIGDARLELDEALTASGSTLDSAAPAPPPQRGLRPILASAAIGIAAVISAAGMWLVTRTTDAPAHVQRLTIALPDGVSYPEVGGGIAMSPDGSRIVFSVMQNGNRMLFLRSLDQLSATPIPGTEAVSSPFFSPDGEWIGFYAVESGSTSPGWKKVPVRGGRAITLLQGARPSAGGSWGADGTMIISTSPAADGRLQLMRVPAAGGEAQSLLVPDPKKSEFLFGWPHVLPDGKSVLFSVGMNQVNFEDSAIALLSLETGTYRAILDRGTRAQYVSTGHIVYMLAGTLMAVPFNLSRLQTTGPPVPILEGVRGRAGPGDASYGVSPTGFLVYAPGGTTAAALRTLVWVDRTGREEPLGVQPRAYMSLQLSPDGSRIALDIRDQENDIWLWDIGRRVMTRVTSGSAPEQSPVWTSDGSRIVFASFTNGRYNLYWKGADTIGTPERLSQSEKSQFASGISHDGKHLVVREIDPKTGYDLRIMDLAGNRQMTPAVQSQFSETNADISPDGRWLAYQSNESGREEIYVSPFPDTGEGRWLVSSEGGTRPVWSRSGRELFYTLGPVPMFLMSVEIRDGARFSAGTPQKLFEGPYVGGNFARIYDVTPDGKRFLMIRDATPTSPTREPSQLVVELNWFEELKRRVPTQ